MATNPKTGIFFKSAASQLYTPLCQPVGRSVSQFILLPSFLSSLLPPKCQHNLNNNVSSSLCSLFRSNNSTGFTKRHFFSSYTKYDTFLQPCMSRKYMLAWHKFILLDLFILYLSTFSFFHKDDPLTSILQLSNNLQLCQIQFNLFFRSLKWSSPVLRSYFTVVFIRKKWPIKTLITARTSHHLTYLTAIV